MTEFIEKLIGRLEEYKDSHLIEHDSEECLHCKEIEGNCCDYRNCLICVCDSTIKIVNEFAEEYKPKTQADKVRSMSDEELAEWLTKITDDAQLDARTKCNYQWEEWLQSEAE